MNGLAFVVVPAFAIACFADIRPGSDPFPDRLRRSETTYGPCGDYLAYDEAVAVAAFLILAFEKAT